MAKKVLVAEDEKNIRSIIKDYLMAEGIEVVEAQNGQVALKLFEQETYDLVILDVMMPIIDGWTVCKQIRAKSNVPIIFLTARAGEEDELMGFTLKADDYVKKPFSPAVLMMRVKKLMDDKREEENIEIITRGALRLDKNAMKVKIEEEYIELTTKEFQILCYLIENEGIVLSRDKILDYIWGYEFAGDIRVVDTHIKKIRKALGEYAYIIRTIFGAGYKFEIE
ncbi:MAG: response regulator transcription factor [Cellulosilyticaceae bacterium]